MGELVEKLWGREDIEVNESEYCLKSLYLIRGHRCSLHYHRKKKETFIVRNGECNLLLVKKDLQMVRYLVPGSKVTIMPGTPHRFWIDWDSQYGICIIQEVSTHHDDEDVVRLEPSDILPRI
jgi:D-lyxose ketol-isomerase